MKRRREIRKNRLAKYLRKLGYRIFHYRKKDHIAFRAKKPNCPVLIFGYAVKRTLFHLWDNGARIAFAPDWYWNETRPKKRNLSPQDELNRFQEKYNNGGA